MNKTSLYLLTAFFWSGFLLQGLFYELPALLVAFVMWGSVGILLHVNRQWRWHPILYILLLFCVIYGIAIAVAVDKEQALLETIKISLLLPVSFLALQLQKEDITKLRTQLVWCGSVLSVMGICFQMVRNGRLESTLQYANALAIFLLVILVISIWRYVESGKRIYLITTIIQGVALWLTFSRSVWVLWGISLLLIGGFAVSRKVWKPAIAIAFCHVASLLLAILLRGDPLFFLHRVQSIQPETAELQIRLIYWRDSIPLIRDYFALGTGGGGWSVLQHLYQSKPYYVKYIHNAYLQFLLDTGIIGFSAFAVWAVWAVIISFKKREWWISLLAGIMLVHAGFDFDLSFPVLFMLLIVMLLQPLDPKVLANTGLRRIGFMLPIGMALLIGYLNLGYFFKQTGIQQSTLGHYEAANAAFSKSVHYIPWSSSVPYEAAKSFIKEAVEERNPKLYEDALQQVHKARQLVSKQNLYEELEIKLSSAPK